MTPEVHASGVATLGVVDLSCSRDAEAEGRSGIGKEVDPKAYGEAVAAALVRSGLFSAVDEAGPADYRLDIVIFDERRDEPIKDTLAVMEYILSSEWTLTRVGDSEPVFHDAFSGRYTATMSDGINGLTRMTRGREGAARESIRLAIEALLADQPSGG